MSEKIKVNERGLEVKRPFKFVALGVDNIGPEDVMEATSSFTYIQGTTNPSIMAPLDNVYDPLIKHNQLFGEFLYLTGNPNEFEYKYANRSIAEALIKRAMSAISQNIIMIFENGFGKFIKPFIVTTEEKPFGLSVVEGVTGDYLVHWEDIFQARTEANLEDPFRCNKELSRNGGDDVITNSLDAIGRIIDKVSNNYNRVITYYIKGDKLDLKAFAKFILTADDISFEDVDESQYIGLVVGALNQVAAEDINKIREIAEIELMQATSQYYKDYCKE